MTIVGDLIARLAAIDPPVFRMVAGAIEFAAISEAAPPATPAAFVMTVEEASGENQRMGDQVMQRMEADVAVVICTENLADRAGAAAAGDIEELKAVVRGEVLGWQPPSAIEPMTHVSGALLKARGGLVWFEDRYAAVTYLIAN